ncbi:MAG: MFS transporter [Flavobacteriales bacterium]|jgi:UMF1 family MFS transporter|nr:MFS transporter [Flavobacteriales bacterium]MBT4881724.1 MFS transporter [Flavobacteriales bacterium]MDG1349180.1 MFS transporter [Flavobacteriales bacterium]|tara:strand:+ start:610 stop:1845 length:1236 start_codon:yes stop_codon:yes gene_type:complete
MSIFKIRNRKEVFAWSIYDFANQPFTTIIVTFIYSAFFVKVIAPNEQEGTFLWSNAIAITAIVVSLLSPILGALADKGGYRKFFLITSTWICAIFSILLYFPNVGDIYFALSCFVIANIAFEMGSVFCNSYLPDLSSTDNIGRISGYAWGLGFVGGLLALFLSLFLFDINNPDEIRKINILVGIWFLLFSIPTFLFVKDRKKEKLNKEHIHSSFQSVKETFRSITNYREISRFLIARLFFNDGLITIFALGGVYAVGTLNFTFEEVMMLGIVLNLCAGGGSFLFGYIEDKIGANKVINISLVVLIVATLIAYYSPETAHPKQWFWVAGVLLGLMVGPNQSCSRSLMARLTPKEKQNEFFGFFALTGKATSFLGPLLFGIVTKFHSQQMALWVVVALLFIGFILFNKINFKE